jgi:hypothetical protein
VSRLYVSHEGGAMLARHRGVRLAVFYAALALMVGCGDSPESVRDDMTGTFEAGADILAGIRDEASAKAAADDLVSWAEDMRELQARAKELGTTSAEQLQSMTEEEQRKLQAASARFLGEMMRVARDPKLSPHLEEALKRANAAMRGE